MVNDLIKQNRELKEFYDDLMNTEGLMSINTMAKELGIGEYKLFAFLGNVTCLIRSIGYFDEFDRIAFCIYRIYGLNNSILIVLDYAVGSIDDILSASEICREIFCLKSFIFNYVNYILNVASTKAIDTLVSISYYHNIMAMRP